jgi:tripartite-type tricarboxylate transporter receptor subunit TctC
MLKKVTLCLTTIFLILLIASVAFAAAPFPNRTITLIVPFGAGGSTDVPARFLANMLEKKLGQAIVIQNVVGAAGTTGVAQLAAARPDGYTLGYIPKGTVSLQPHVQNLPYGRDSFDFLGMVTRQPAVLMSSKHAPWQNFQEMIEMVRKEPNKYIVAITGTGNMTHLPVAILAKHFDLKLRYIPYRSTPEVMKDMITGRVHLHADNPVPLSQFDIFGLVQFADTRADNLDFPTTKEMGFDRAIYHWQGVVAPKGLPEDVKKTLVQAIKEVVQSPEFIDGMEKIATHAHWMGLAEFTRFFEEEFNSYRDVLKELIAN